VNSWVISYNQSKSRVFYLRGKSVDFRGYHFHVGGGLQPSKDEIKHRGG